MPALAEIQALVRDAVVTGDARDVLSLLIGGREPAQRLSLHHRHYESSLVAAILGTFPATAWLVGSATVTESARAFISQYPPAAPCIAEYGDAFPRFLATCPIAERVPYLRPFAELEWHVGRVALAVNQPALAIDALAEVPPARLPDARLVLQPGVRYVLASWPVNELMELYMTGAAPDHLSFEPAETPLEVYGARGTISVRATSIGDWVFRSRVSNGSSIGDAADSAIDRAEQFDAGRALATLIGDGLVAAIRSD
jgi:hypothetical protein